MTFSQNWGYKLLQCLLWPFPSSRTSTWQSICGVLVSSAFYPAPDVLSLESIDPSSDVASYLAIDVYSARKKWVKVKQRCHVVSERQSHVVLLFGREVSSDSLFGYLPTVQVFPGCEQACYIARPAHQVWSLCVEDFLKRHITCENRAAAEQGAQHHGQSCANLWEASIESQKHYHQTA